MQTSSATSGSQAKVLIGVAIGALVICLGVGAALFVLTSEDGGELSSSAIPASGDLGESDREPEVVYGVEADDEPDDRPADVGTDTGTDAGVSGADPIAAARRSLSETAESHLGGSDPVGLIAEFTDAVGEFPVTDDAVVESFGLEVDRELRDGRVRIQYRTSINYLSERSVDDTLALYRSETTALDLPERESEIDSDDEGPFTVVEFGDFASHPDPTIWWANLHLEVRATDSGSHVRIYYTVTRTDEAVPTGLLADLEAALPLLDGYENKSVRVSALTIDPFTRPLAFSVDMGASARLDDVVADEDAEAARIGELATTDPLWTIDDRSASGVWIRHAEVDSLRGYLTVQSLADFTLARYSY